MLAEASQLYYQADSRVSPSLSQENVSAAKTSVGCGQSTLDSFGKPTPLGLLLRMLPLSQVFQSSGKYTKTLNPKITKSGFCRYELRMSVPHTSAPAVSWLPTPTASDHKRAKVSPADVMRKSPGLPVFAAILPTPTTSQDYKPIREMSPSEKNGTHGVMLCAALAEKGVHFLPTPLASVTDPIRPFKAKELMRHTKGAKRFGKMLPGQIGDAMPSLIGKTIHPQFVEWMMGFPKNWTNPDCKLSAMQLCQDVCIQSLMPSQELKEVNVE